MEIEILVDASGFESVDVVRVAEGATGRELVAIVANKGGFPVGDALLFVEDGEHPIDPTGVLEEEATRGKVHHVHRAKHIDVDVFYKADRRSKRFSPSTRVQCVLDWASGLDGFRIDSAIAPEMELALHNQTVELPKSAHLGRFVRHDAGKISLNLIRGVIPNGGS